MNHIFIKILNEIAKIYYFIFRPTTKGVKALIFNRGRVLMVRLSYFPNTWTFPGGGVKRGESPKGAVIRECMEEVGIKLEEPNLLGNLYFEHEYKKDTVYIFKEEVTDDRIKIDNKEVIEAGWYRLDKLPIMGENTKAIFDFVMNI